MSGSPVRISSARQLNYSEGIPDNLIPTIGYLDNLGSPFKKWLSIYAGELNVETLVAQDTIATIGGRILVGPTTILTSDLPSGSSNVFSNLNPGFEIAGSGGSDIFDSWQEALSSGSIARSGSYPHSGTYSCQITGGSASFSSVFQYLTVNEGDSYYLTLWGRGDGVSAGQFAVTDITHGPDLIVGGGITSTAWTQKSGSFVIPSGCSSIRLILYQAIGVAATIFWDDVALYRGVLKVKHNEMVTGDIVYLENSSKVEFMQITSPPSGSGPYAYTVFRDLDGTGENDWYAGDAVFNSGSINDGFIDLYSAHGIKSVNQFGPTIAGNVRNSITYNDWITRWAIGNLNGLYDYSSTTWGAAFGGYGSGSANITIDNVNGIRLRNYNQTVIQLDNSGSAIIAGKLSMPGASGAITIGAIPPISASVGTGIWIDRTGLYGLNSGSPQAYIGSDGNFYAGLGKIRIDANGIQITDVSTSARFIQWAYHSGSAYNLAGYVSGNYSGSSSPNAAMWLTGYRDATSPWQIANTTISVFDIEHSKDARVNLSASGSGTALDITSFDYINIPSGNVGIGSSNATQKLVVNGSAIVYGDFYTVPWTDYSGTSTVVGWASTTNKSIKYKKVGKLLFCQYHIAGTSGSTATTFTLPYLAIDAGNTYAPCAALDNSLVVNTPIAFAGNPTVQFYKDYNGTAWTASGTKVIAGEIFFETV